MLIDASELSRHLQDPAWIVFDCRHDLTDVGHGCRVYAEGHVPGAFFVPVDSVMTGPKTATNGRHPLPAPEDFAGFLNRHGVTPAMQIVAYDDVGGQYAARLWWLARWIGLTRVAVLDGGLSKWLASGRVLTKEVPPARGCGSVIARPDPSRTVDAAAILAEIGTRRFLVVDARAPERFRGEIEPIDRVAGHIPAAHNRFFKTNLNPDQTMRSPQELRGEFAEALGATKPAQVVHQCGSGITACVNLLAMEHAGLTGSKLYVGSWSEWISDPSRPIARG